MKVLLPIVLLAALWATTGAANIVPDDSLVPSLTVQAPGGPAVDAVSAASPDTTSDLGRAARWSIAVLAIVLIFGTPVMIVAMVLYASHRKRRLARDMASQFLASGQPVPPEVWRGLARDRSPRDNLRNGMVMLALGLGVFLCFWLIGSMAAAYLGLIPLFIGIALLLIWMLEKSEKRTGD